MGVDPYSFVSALNGIVAQRLVRVNCSECVTDDFPDEALILESGLNLEETRNVHFRRGTGCGHCRGTGFKGRKAIAEILNLNDELRELIIGKQPVRLVREAAKRNGIRLLREGALDMVFRGETTLQEINRVTFIAR
jgi:general secretion pathway protein E